MLEKKKAWAFLIAIGLGACSSDKPCTDLCLTVPPADLESTTSFPTAFLPDGRFYILNPYSDVIPAPANVAPGLTRFLADGTFDSSFQAIANLNAYIALDDGSVLGVVLSKPDGSDQSIQLQRFLTTGALDGSFSSPKVPLGKNEMQFFAMGPVSDGKTLLGTCGYDAGTGDNFVGVQWNADGSLDTSYGSQGVATVYGSKYMGGCSTGSFSANADGSTSWLLNFYQQQSRVITMDARGALISSVSFAPVSLAWPNAQLVTSVWTNASPLLIVDPNSLDIFSLGSPTSTVTSVASLGNWAGFLSLGGFVQLPSGGVLLAGTTGQEDWGSSEGDLVLAMLTPSGLLDSSFGIGGIWVQPSTDIVAVDGINVNSDGSFTLAVTKSIEGGYGIDVYTPKLGTASNL